MKKEQKTVKKVVSMKVNRVRKEIKYRTRI